MPGTRRPRGGKTPKSIGSAGGRSLCSEILDAARKLYFEAGPAAVTARKIAAVVGCTAPAIYRHYHGIGDILHVLRMEGHGLLGCYLGGPSKELRSDERLVSMQDEYFRFGREHPRYFGMMFPVQLGATGSNTSEVPSEIGAEEAASLLIVRDEAARGIERGEIRTDLAAIVVANHCWLAVHSLTSTFVSGHLAFTAPDLCDVLLEQVKEATAAWLQAAPAR